MQIDRELISVFCDKKTYKECFEALDITDGIEKAERESIMRQV